MKARITFNQVKGLADAYRNHPEKCIRALYATSSIIASDLEAKARKNAKWTDRTGQARKSITGSSEANGTTISIKLEGYATSRSKKIRRVSISSNKRSRISLKAGSSSYRVAGKEYFQYLEFAKQKKYSILEPTIKENRQEAINRYANAMKSVNLEI